MVERIYDGNKYCRDSGCTTTRECPVIDHDKSNSTVTFHDPTKPESGRFTITVEKYNQMVSVLKKTDFQFPIHVTSA